MGASIEDDDRSDGSYDSDFTGSSGSDSESDTFSPQQAAQVRTPISAWAINSQPGVSLSVCLTFLGGVRIALSLSWEPF